MSDAFVILGERATGKSAIIRALTGVRMIEYNYKVETSQGLHDFLIHIRSLQEVKLSPASFLHLCESLNSKYILFSLRINAANNQPNGLKYIQDFLSAKWNFRGIVVLGTANLPYKLPVGLPNPNYIQHPMNMATNANANQVRQWWQWL